MTKISKKIDFFKSPQNDLKSIVLVILAIVRTTLQIFVTKSAKIFKNLVHQNSEFCLQEFSRAYHYDQNFEKIEFSNSHQIDLQSIVLVILAIPITSLHVFVMENDKTMQNLTHESSNFGSTIIFKVLPL